MKKALIIGINYVGTSCALNGCWNDAYSMRDHLEKSGFNGGNIRIMTDEPHLIKTENYPSKSNMIAAISKFITESTSGDHLVFHYSGHGGSMPDYNGDELDGRDECIFPRDGSIVDDVLRRLLVDQLPEGVKLRCIMDCCHSGTGMDLPWRYDVRNRMSQVHNKDIQESKLCRPGTDIVCISGCQDRQTSADAWIDRRAQGALTANFIKVSSSCQKGMLWKDFITVLQWKLSKDGYEQIPQLSLAQCEAKNQTFDFRE